MAVSVFPRNARGKFVLVRLGGSFGERLALFLIGLSLSAGRSVKAHPPLIVHADAVLSMSTRQGGQGQDMPSKGARCQSLEATIPCDELAVCQNGETKVAPVVDRAVKL